MQDRYDPKSIEPRWQEHWAKHDLFRAGNRPGAPKKYILAMLPYPSGEMHMGHARVYCITDVLCSYQRKRGFDVLHPFGWDSFGLPAENAAIKEGVHPAIRTPKNIKSFKADVNSLGISVDWTTELATSDPAYYREPVVLPAHARARPRLPPPRQGQLLPLVQHGARQRAGRGGQVLALRLDGGRARDPRVGLSHHRLRRQAARGSEQARLAGARGGDAAQLDRPIGRSGDRL